MDIESFTCIYCDKNLPIKESSLEHVIPQFLGGDYVSNIFKIKDACKKCNNKLGLFVDASYAKSFFVTNYLSLAARGFYSGGSCPPLPLTFMGTFSSMDVDLLDNYTVDNWLGPTGECIFWMHPKDERMYWYAGGNPTHRKYETTAYLSLTDRPNSFELGLKSFLHKFKGKKTRRILCTEIIDSQGKKITPNGFDVPTTEEKITAQKLLDVVFSKQIQVETSLYIKFDSRFIAKLVLSIGYVLFGNEFLATKQAKAARNDLWKIDDLEGELKKTSSLDNIDNDQLKKIMSYPGANVIFILRSGALYYLSISVNGSMFSMTEFAPASLSSKEIDLSNGLILLLFPYLKSSLQLNFFDFIQHKNGSLRNTELAKIDDIREASTKYWESIKANIQSANPKE